ncbi:MAG: 50S ribosomal protein L18 [Candidatus Magnetoovum sp. WYHC-5]|nr:50S ribosomal protein L18 [Candidatus Magnetoovum sp. WYHC-5]
MIKTKDELRYRRHKRVRKKVKGTAERPRLAVFKSLKHIYAQVIDDGQGRTLAAASSLDKAFKDEKVERGNVEFAKKIGALIAQKSKLKGISMVVFDKGGFKYHGRVKALADAAREAGLVF